MSCDNQFRHVCFKDLQNYIERDKYFSDFTKDEIALIQKNLGIPTSTDEDSYNPTIIVGNYTEIQQQASVSNLKIGYTYIIKDFRSIYQDINGKTCGLDDYIPSKEYRLFLTPASTSTFDKRVQLLSTDLSTDNVTTWTVEYDITPVMFADGTINRGTITFLKDNNNNYAYYDFKNIKFKKTLDELNKGATTYKEDTYLYTFDNNGTDASLSCKNNHLEYGAYRNVFLGNTQNVTLAADCHDNIFFKNCENCVFDYGTYGNFFKDNVVRCHGTVHEKELDSITAMTCPKHFDVLNDKEVISYLDSETQTYQFKQL